LSSAGKRPITLPVKNCKNFTLLLLILLQAGDIDFITRNEGKRQIRPKKFDNCISTNIVTRLSRINSKSVKAP
jgi:hypothetical protein